MDPKSVRPRLAMAQHKKEQQREERLKRRIVSEEVKPEESRRARRKEKRAKVASMAWERDEQLMGLKWRRQEWEMLQYKMRRLRVD